MTTASALDRLSPKRARFAREYVIDLNGTKAVIRAGYSAKGARQRAALLLADSDVAEAVAELQAATAEKLEITKEVIIRELWNNHQIAMQGVPGKDRYGKPLETTVPQIAASNKALDQIGELLGFKVARSANLNVDIGSMSAAELDRAEDELEAQIRKLENAETGQSLH